MLVEQRNLKRLYDITRTMSEKRSRPPKPVKNKERVLMAEEQEQRAKWVEYFRDILNRPPPTEMPNITATEELLLNVTVNPPPEAEIERALKQLKNGKAARPDSIPGWLKRGGKEKQFIISQLSLCILYVPVS